MFKLSKKADYGLIAVKHLAMHRQEHACSANEIAEEYGISVTLMAKVLQRLAREGVVVAKHGSTGGYQLAKDPGQVSALDVISAIDGPVLITSCVTSHGNCETTERCSVREPLRKVNESILGVLSTVTIAQMSEDPNEPALVALSGTMRSGSYMISSYETRKWLSSCRFTWIITQPRRLTRVSWTRCCRISRKSLEMPQAAIIVSAGLARKRSKQ